MVVVQKVLRGEKLGFLYKKQVKEDSRMCVTWQVPGGSRRGMFENFLDVESSRNFQVGMFLEGSSKCEELREDSGGRSGWGLDDSELPL